MRRRILYLLPAAAVAHALGIALADIRWLTADVASLLAAASLAAALVLLRWPTASALCVCSLFFALGGLGLSLRLEEARRVAVEESFSAVVEGVVCWERAGTIWISVELCDVARPAGVALETGALEHPVPSRLHFGGDRARPEGVWLADLVAGEWVRLRARIRPMRRLANPGARSGGTASLQSLRRRGVGGFARLIDPALAVRIPERNHATAMGSLQPLRVGVGDRLAATGRGGALLRALAVGDRSALVDSDREGFARLGIAHLLAVSGLHLALVSALAYTLLRVAFARSRTLAARWDTRLVAAWGAGFLGFSYALLAGWGVPVQRATVFLAAAGVGLLLRRRASGAHVLALASLAILAAAPDQLFEPGTQLSFAATGALLGALRAAPSSGAGWWGSLRGAFESGLRVSATAIAATAPILAWHGIPAAVGGLIANAFAVPWTALVLLPTSLGAAVLVSLSPGVLPESVVWLPLAGAEWIGRVTLIAVERVAENVPFPAAGSGLARAGWAVAVGVAIALLALRARTTWRRALLATLVTVWLGIAPSTRLGSPEVPAPPRVVIFDVGLGDSVLVEGRSAAVLVDGGWATPDGADLGRSAVVPGLRALAVRALDVVVATHADADHRGGLERVLADLPVGALWLPHGGLAAPDFRRLRALAATKGVPVTEHGAGEPAIRVGDLSLEPLWPPADLTAASRNDRSLVLRIEIAGMHILMTGDIGLVAEGGLLARRAELRADVLKVAHHGSRRSSSREFLSAVGADVAVVSAPCPGRGGLPNGAALERVRAQGMALWWTGRDGAVLLDLDAANSRVAVWSWEASPRCSSPSSSPR